MIPSKIKHRLAHSYGLQVWRHRDQQGRERLGDPGRPQLVLESSNVPSEYVHPITSNLKGNENGMNLPRIPS